MLRDFRDLFLALKESLKSSNFVKNNITELFSFKTKTNLNFLARVSPRLEQLAGTCFEF